MADYNPNDRYTWKPEDKFEITGQQFGLILNMVRQYLSSEDAGKFMLMQQTNDVIESIMKNGVESGVIVNAPEPDEPENTSTCSYNGSSKIKTYG